MDKFIGTLSFPGGTTPGAIISKRAFEAGLDLKTNSKFSSGEHVLLDMSNKDSVSVIVVQPYDNQHYIVAAHIDGDYYAVLNPVHVNMLQPLTPEITKESIHQKVIEYCEGCIRGFDEKLTLWQNEMDSLDGVELLVTLESDFDIDLDDVAIDHESTVDKIVELVYEQCMERRRKESCKGR